MNTRLIGRTSFAFHAGMPENESRRRTGIDVKWVTSKGIKISRAATAWLIRRFIDPDAELLFVSPAEVVATAKRENGIGFHVVGSSYPAHEPGGESPFEALVTRYCPDNAALREMGRIVANADRPGRADSPPEASGLRLISAAFPLVARDDMDTVVRSQFMYDALYAALEVRLQRSNIAQRASSDVSSEPSKDDPMN